MNNNKQKPVIFLAFANDRVDGIRYLRNLSEERSKICDILDEASKNDLCEVVHKSDVTISQIFNVFQDERYRNRIAIFHFAGHANSYQLLLRDSLAFAEGIVPLLARQNGLTFVFLNGCCTKNHILKLINEGIPSAVGTFDEVDDKIATDLAIRFYKGFGDGLSLERSWKDAVDYIKAKKGKIGKKNDLPWIIKFNKKFEDDTKKWNLTDAAKNPLFGLPLIPPFYGYPKPPYRYLESYKKKHSRIFFGRSIYIRSLFYKTTGNENPPITLFYGQSGVGKSSLLEAGLFPRLEETHIVLYSKRTWEKGLLGTLDELLNGLIRNKEFHLKKNGISFEEKWKLIVPKKRQPIVIILDQVEEAYMNPNKKLPSELDDFFNTIKKIFGNLNGYSNSKMILCYRKEFHPEIEARFTKLELTYGELFLEPLGRKGIIEVVTGLTSTQALLENYNLKIEDRLPEIIADDLLEDKTTPVAPMLQFILSKMWEISNLGFSNIREFKMDTYQDQICKEGIAMETFFSMQMAELGKWDEEVVDSGLALDLLKHHTTKMGTACFKNIEDLHKTYKNREDILGELLKMEKNVYLLTDVHFQEKQKIIEGTSLAHDTLAPIVIREYNDSDKPGQRASRILAGKAEDFKKDKKNVWLNEVDLEIVEQGRKGMRALDKDEEELLEISRQRKARHEKLRKRTIQAAVVLISFLIISTIFALYQWKTAQKNNRKAKANHLIILSNEIVKEDPTLALRLVEKAYTLDKSEYIKETIYKIYEQNIFYKTIVKRENLNRIPPHASGKKFSYNSLGDKTVPLSAFQGIKTLRGIELQTFIDYKRDVNSVAFSPDDKYILVALGDKDCRLWDLNGKEVKALTKYWTNTAVFSPNAQYILCGDGDGIARLYDLQGNECRSFRGHQKSIISVTFSPDGKYVLTGSNDGIVRLWNLMGENIQNFTGHNKGVFFASFSPDGKLVLTGSWDNSIRLWSLQGIELKNIKMKKNLVSLSAFSPDGKNFLAGYYDGTAHLWNIEGNKLQSLTGHKNQVNSVAFSPDGRYILTGSEDKIAKLWDFKGKELLSLVGHKSGITSVSFSKDGRYVLSGSTDTVRLWNLRSKDIHIYDGHVAPVCSVAFHPYRKCILTGSNDKTIRIWNLQGKHLETFGGHKDKIYSVAFSPDGNTILTGSWDSTARLWDLQGKQLQGFNGHKDRVYHAVFSPDGKRILTGSKDETALLWDLQGNPLQIFRGHKDIICSVAFSPDGNTILTGSWDGTARLWDSQGHTLQVFNGHKDRVYHAVFSPDGNTILTGSWDSTARLWDLHGNTLEVFNGHKKGVISVAFSPDGNTVLTGSWDSTARLWDLQGNTMQVFFGHKSGVVSVAFSPAGESILTGSWDKTARLWELKIVLDEFLKKGLCEQLSEEQKKKYGIED